MLNTDRLEIGMVMEKVDKWKGETDRENFVANYSFSNQNNF